MNFLLPAIVIVTLISLVKSGPTKRLLRTAREVYPDIEYDSDKNQTQVCIVGDVVYGLGDTVPAEQICLKCKCQAPSVLCETIRCVKQPGCRAIHQPMKCCPDYHCECEHNGKTYANGERLETTPGGECKVCYCRGGEVQCADVSCYVRKDCEGKEVPGQCCLKYDHCPPIDNLSRNDSVNIEQAVFNNWSNPDNLTYFQDENKIFDTTLEEVTIQNKLLQNAEIEIDNLTIENNPLTRITIHEIIPDTRDITEPGSTNDSSALNDFDGVQNNSNDLVTDSEAESSEILEVFHPPPPVLKVGDKLIYLKKSNISPDQISTPSVITIIGAEGLQRGGMEDSSEVHETIKTSDKINHSLFDNVGAINDLELKTSESTHILSLVKRKKTEVSTTVKTTKEASTTVREPLESTTEGTVEDSTTINDEITSSTTESTEESLIESTTQTFDNSSQVQEKEGTMKILPEVLEIRSNKTVSEISNHSQWLKQGQTLINLKAALPTSLLNEPAPSDESYDSEVEIISTTESSTDSSEELTTINSNKESSILSTENASLESLKAASNEAADMLQQTKEKNPVSSDVSLEKFEPTTQSSDLIDSIEEHTPNNTNIEIKERDVELISVPSTDSKPIKMEMPSSKETRSLEKRANSEADETDAVFKQLNDELFADQTERIQTKEEERQESDSIFKQLLEETATPKTKVKPKNKEEETLQRVSDAIAQLTLRGKQADSNILGLLSSFFGNQNRYSSKK